MITPPFSLFCRCQRLQPSIQTLLHPATLCVGAISWRLGDVFASWPPGHPLLHPPHTDELPECDCEGSIHG